MRDWTKTLRRASYRGVPFWVSLDDFDGGKRLVRHEYAGGRHTFVEEMGLATSGIEVTGYLISDESDIEATALGTALLAPGPGRLVLPISGGQLATAESFRRSWEKDRLGHIALSMYFVPATNAPIAALGAVDVIAAFAANFAPAMAGFGRLF
ncbi:DNA circularization N-terminal domain-containing protein [Rhizobium sp. RU36D]|uniref:DNA circularization N-terminal domain-containing protein n=1 Tax=Rhizobium sp. RU36D TaxID=1907415 RepID=UPI0009D7FC10|nr:DNA circularization N-terminal domain-containing protein [Rhizobium sp. RU36D]SMD18474.1 DNA circularisation protein N-terminus [Rhizobium sp. RU36D]